MADEINFGGVIERQIVKDLIVSKKAIEVFLANGETKLLVSPIAQTLAKWCVKYYKKYKQAPKDKIEIIFAEKLTGSDSDTIADISEILNSLSDEYEKDSEFSQADIDRIVAYCRKRKIEEAIEQLQNLAENNRFDDAEKLITDFRSSSSDDISYNVELSEQEAYSQEDDWEESYNTNSENVIHYPKALGEFWNAQLVRGGFVALLAPEKRGKSFLMLDMAMRGVATGSTVILFQAGDMTEAQQMARIGAYVAHSSTRKKNCESILVPCLDCWHNQKGDCPLPENANKISLELPYESPKLVKYEDLESGVYDIPSYTPCNDCLNAINVPYLKKLPSVPLLTKKVASNAFAKWKRNIKGRFFLSTYSNDSLTIHEINAQLDRLKQEKGVSPDVVIIDYADILAPEPNSKNMDFRNQQNQIWKKMRALSQDRKCLVVTATQAAKSSYGKETLELTDFSEDKRKFAHVTAMYSMNQTTEEKKIGILRLSELVVRDDNFNADKQVKIMQCLSRGRPVIGSYF